jgi:hypothetical protein
VAPPRRGNPQGLSWLSLNDKLKNTNASDEVLLLLRTAIKQGNRLAVVKRIYARYSVLRRKEELASLVQKQLPETMRAEDTARSDA